MKLNYEQTKNEIEPEAKQNWESDASLRASFGYNFDRYHAYLASVVSGRSKVLGGQVK